MVAYPDPRNRDAFLDFVDRRIAQRLSLAEVEAEGFYWARWLRDEGMVARSPSPGKGLLLAGGGIGIIGTICSLAGLLGFLSKRIGEIATLGGALAVIGGFLVTQASTTRITEDEAAAERVGIRLDELTERLEAIGPISLFTAGGRQTSSSSRPSK